MKKIIYLSVLCIVGNVAVAQDVYKTKTGQIVFASKSKVEKIEAVNNEVSTAIDIKKGEIVFAVLLKGFHFERALMEEHFNEDYVESDKFPKSTFRGKIVEPELINFGKDGTYQNVIVEGDLNMHGVTKKVKASTSFVIKGGVIKGASKFNIKLEDFNIKIPSLVADKISKDVDLTVSCVYSKG
jgi:hypothetical protein